MTGKIHITCRETGSLGPEALGVAETTLSTGERERAGRFRLSEDRRDYILAHDLLRRSLSQLEPVAPAAWEFHTGQHGKPFVRASTLAFSLSHTRGFVACAVGRDVRLGVDVERIDRPADAAEIARRFFARSEADALERCPPDQRATQFIELWTLKEAYVKAIGLGLSQPLKELSFDLQRPDHIGFAAPHASGSWAFALFEPWPRTRLSVAASGMSGDPVRFVARTVKPGDDGRRVDALRKSVVS